MSENPESNEQGDSKLALAGRGLADDLKSHRRMPNVNICPTRDDDARVP
jgi:hypothetical protein